MLSPPPTKEEEEAMLLRMIVPDDAGPQAALSTDPWPESRGGKLGQLVAFDSEAPLVFYPGLRESKIAAIRGGHGRSVAIGGLKGFSLQKEGFDEIEKNVVEGAFGARHALLVDESGDLWAKGDGEAGQLGLGARCLKTKDEQDGWVKLRFGPKKAAFVACGGRHSACVTQDGDLYTWGRGFEGQTGYAPMVKGQLSHKKKRRVVAPPPAPSPSEEAQLVSEDDDSEDEVYVEEEEEEEVAVVAVVKDDLAPALHGIQLLPKLVVGLSPSGVYKPGRLPVDKVAAVSCGENFTMALTRAGVLWAFGEGRSGELGCSQRLTAQRSPRRVDVGKVSSIACGFAHCLAIVDGQIYAWGLNVHGQLGFEGSSSVLKPTLLEIEDVTAIDASGHCSGCLSNGSLYTWGKGLSPIPKNSGLEKVGFFALSEGSKGVAFLPSRLSSSVPEAAPFTGGSQIVFKGGALWDTPDIKVKFETDDENFLVDGTFSEGSIVCELPCFATFGEVRCEVALNGTDFTDSGYTMRVYGPPTIQSMTPASLPAGGGTTIELTSPDFVDYGGAKMRLTCSSTGEEWTVPATFEEDRASCLSPELVLPEERYPVRATVGIALNGVDFAPCEGELIVHNARLDRCEPDARQVGKGKVKLCGFSFFETPDLFARLTVGDDQHRCECSFVDSSTLSLTLPVLEESKRLLNCLVEVGVEGETVVKEALPLTLHFGMRPADITKVTPATGPASGGTTIELSLGEFFAEIAEDAPSRYPRLKVSMAGTKIPAKFKKGEKLVIVFQSPAVELPMSTAAPVEDDEEPVPKKAADLATQIAIALDGENYSPLFLQGFTHYATPKLLTLKRKDSDSLDVEPGSEVSAVGEDFYAKAECLVRFRYDDKTLTVAATREEAEEEEEEEEAPSYSFAVPDLGLVGEAPTMLLNVDISFNGADYTQSCQLTYHQKLAVEEKAPKDKKGKKPPPKKKK